MTRIFALLFTVIISLPTQAVDVTKTSFNNTLYMTPLAQIKHRISLGDKNAMFNLASLYYDPGETKAIPQSYALAARLYRKAAKKGHLPSQYNLGLMYIDGEGVRTDYATGYAWISVAYESGLLQAKETLDQLKVAMKPSQLEAGEAMKNDLLRTVRK